jgi:4-carboxymuconolactone decarboxylase
MADQPKQFGGGRTMLGDFAPKLAELTDDMLFEDVWNRPELSAGDRTLITSSQTTSKDEKHQDAEHIADDEYNSA